MNNNSINSIFNTLNYLADTPYRIKGIIDDKHLYWFVLNNAAATIGLLVDSLIGSKYELLDSYIELNNNCKNYFSLAGPSKDKSLSEEEKRNVLNTAISLVSDIGGGTILFLEEAGYYNKEDK